MRCFFLICLLNLIRLKKNTTVWQKFSRQRNINLIFCFLIILNLVFFNRLNILVCHYSFQIEKKTTTTFLQVSHSLEKKCTEATKNPIKILKNASDVGQNILSTKKIILQCWLFSHQMCVLPIDSQHSFVQFNSFSHVSVR